MNPSVQTSEVLPARAVLFLGILAFHVLLAYLFATGLVRTTVQMLVPPMDTTIIPDKPRQPPQPQIENPTVQPTTLITAVAPEIHINESEDPPVAPLVAQAISDPKPYPPGEPVSVAEPPLRMVGRNVMPNTEDYYPARDRRDGNEGTAQVRSCVNVNGRLDGTPTVEASSGRESLDSAAVQHARRHCRATRDPMWPRLWVCRRACR